MPTRLGKEVTMVAALPQLLPLSGLGSRRCDLGHQREYLGSPPIPRAVASGE